MTRFVDQLCFTDREYGCIHAYIIRLLPFYWLSWCLLCFMVLSLTNSRRVIMGDKSAHNAGIFPSLPTPFPLRSPQKCGRFWQLVSLTGKEYSQQDNESGKSCSRYHILEASSLLMVRSDAWGQLSSMALIGFDIVPVKSYICSFIRD